MPVWNKTASEAGRLMLIRMKGIVLSPVCSVAGVKVAMRSADSFEFTTDQALRIGKRLTAPSVISRLPV